MDVAKSRVLTDCDRKGILVDAIYEQHQAETYDSKTYNLNIHSIRSMNHQAIS